MELYKNLYFTLFGKVEDALVLMDDGNVWEAKNILLRALDQAEETYMTADEEPPEEIVLSELAMQIRKVIRRLDKGEQEAICRLIERRTE
ncbi:MAG: hypothetical protein E7425_08755 [Ruminococcaceae bacterium]|nr:hypothetical protein [Oscillospiraceae bacterium]